MKQVTIKPPKQAPRDISTKLPPGVPPSARVIFGDFAPTADFTDKGGVQPDDYIVGKFVGARDTVIDGRETRVYDFENVKDEHTGLVHKMVSVFGSTILNRYMTPQNGVVPGRMVSITYIGTVKTKRGLNPAKVVRAALQDAASVAGLLVTTEAMVAELPKKKAPPAAPGAGAGAGMGDMDF